MEHKKIIIGIATTYLVAILSGIIACVYNITKGLI